MSVLEAYKNIEKKNECDVINKRINCLSIGDGSTPRTSVLSLYLQNNWECISIDPQLQPKWNGTSSIVKGLKGYSSTIEEFMSEPTWFEEKGELVIFMVHSHARLKGVSSIERIRGKMGELGGSCCWYRWTYCLSTFNSPLILKNDFM